MIYGTKRKPVKRCSKFFDVWCGVREPKRRQKWSKIANFKNLLQIATNCSRYYNGREIFDISNEALNSFL